MSRDYDEGEYDNDEPEHEPLARESSGSNRLLLPGIFMIVTGIVNLLIGGSGFFFLATVMAIPDANLQEILDQMDPAQRADAANQLGLTGPAELRRFYGYVFGGGGGVMTACALLTIIGGVCMCARKARGLAVVSAIVTLLPVASPCCFLGFPVGLWSVIALFSRSAPESSVG